MDERHTAAPSGPLPPPPPGALISDPEATVIARIVGVYPPPVAGTPPWVAASLSDGKVALMPLADAFPTTDGVRVPYRSEDLQAAPPAPAGALLDDADLRAAVSYYYPGSAPSEPLRRPSASPSATPGPLAIRSEEQLRVRTERVPVQRVRLRRFVVTREHTITVRLRHEEFRMEREDCDPQPAFDSRGHDAGSDEEVVMVLRAERPVVSTEVVPVELVRVSKYLVADEQVVTDSVRREVVEPTMEGHRPETRLRLSD